MQILYLFVFGCFLSECLTVTTKEIEEFESIFDVFVKLTEHKDLFFSTLTKLRNVCLCAHGQLEKINADLENGIRDAPPDVQSKAIMMQDTLKGLMSKLPREKATQNECPMRRYKASHAKKRFNNFFMELRRNNCTNED